MCLAISGTGPMVGIDIEWHQNPELVIEMLTPQWELHSAYQKVMKVTRHFFVSKIYCISECCNVVLISAIK